MTLLWKWIVVFWVICTVISYAVPSQFFDTIQTLGYADSPGYGVATAVLFAVALITLIRFPFRMHLPAVVAGSTAITAILFIIGHIIFASNTVVGAGIFAFSLMYGLMTIRLGSLYGEDISATKTSSNIHLSQAVEFLVVYVVMMIKLLPIQVLQDIGLFLIGIWHREKPVVDQLIRDLSSLFQSVMEAIF